MITRRNREALVAVVLGVAALVAGIQLINIAKGEIANPGNESIIQPAGTIRTSAVDVSIGWNQTWGGNNSDYGTGIWSDGSSVYSSGFTYSAGAGAADVLLVKWDAAGHQLWNRTWGYATGDVCNSIWGSGTAIYTCGETFVVSKWEMLLVKWDTDGNQLWNRTFGGSSMSSGKSVWIDGSAVYTCGEVYNGSNGNDLLLVKWDSDGNKLWNRTWGGAGTEQGTSVRGSGSVIYTCGYTDSFGAGGYDMLLVKWDDSGSAAWNRTWGFDGGDVAFDLWTDGTAIYTCGRTYATYGYLYGNYDDIALLKYRSNGTLEMNKTWGSNATEQGKAIAVTSSAIYVLGNTNAAGNDDFLLVQWDLAGNPLGNITWGGNDTEYGNALWSDGTSIYACGDTYSFGAGDVDNAIIKWILPSAVLGIDLVPYIALVAVSAIAFLAIKLKRVRGVA
nr:hypothetical protein [Candidatus Sigynarchaeota archaeon]